MVCHCAFHDLEYMGSSHHLVLTSSKKLKTEKINSLKCIREIISWGKLHPPPPTHTHKWRRQADTENHSQL